MEILISLLALLALSILLGKLCERFGVTDIVGQIIAGVILGPAVLNLISPSSVLSSIAEVAIFFVLLFIGIQITTETLTGHFRSAIYFTLSSFVVPIAVMSAIAIYFFHISYAPSIITAIGIGVPSISIISVLVYRYSLIHTEDGIRLLSGVIFTDILAFVILAAMVRLSHIVLTLIGLAVFIAIFLYFDRELKLRGEKAREFFKKLLDRKAEDLIFAIVILASLLISAILQFIGITYVLGALFAGMLIHKTTFGSRTTRILQNTFRRLNDSFFIPVFFSIAGIEVSVPTDKYLQILLIMVAISIVVGGALNAYVAKRRMSKLKARDAVGILGSRGAVGIIIASVAFQAGIISSDLYTIVVAGTIAMSIIMPLLLSRRKY
ncbi:cation:proton antiporter [Candidatus Marsarchaeota archaeon]|nr:cation:proton antiporter [Candidatus Marsarchaeota archaeon]MCL5404809.1 cation:proton antiporter [Candidatus Marsarchaeota archaeon]